jgi:hypothetical protein
MFYVTIVNFILFSIAVGTEVAGFVIFVRKALIELVHVPLAQRPAIVNKTMITINITEYWASLLNVSLEALCLCNAELSLFNDRYWSVTWSLFGAHGCSTKKNDGSLACLVFCGLGRLVGFCAPLFTHVFSFMNRNTTYVSCTTLDAGRG